MARLLVTRNVSASSMYFETTNGPPLSHVVLLEMQHAQLKLTLIGEIVRIEHRAGKTGIAIKFRTAQLRP